jgi:hypothetical protein
MYLWVQGTQGRPQQKCVSVKEVLEAHPYVNAEPQDQVHRYRVRYLIYFENKEDA